jgi:hypothetical protein
MPDLQSLLPGETAIASIWRPVSGLRLESSPSKAIGGRPGCKRKLIGEIVRSQLPSFFKKRGDITFFGVARSLPTADSVSDIGKREQGNRK